jgi:hypothetical protein
MTLLRKFCVLTVPAVCITFLALELFFRFILPSSEVPYIYYDQADKIMRYDTRFLRNGTYTMGKWAHPGGKWRINNYGWNSEIDYSTEKNGRDLIAIIGDSYVQAFEVDAHNSFPALLRERLGKRYLVYSFGIAGAPLSQYLQMTRYVRKHFKPDILIYNVVHNDFSESLLSFSESPYFLRVRPENGTFAEVQPISYKSNSWKRLLKPSALARYFYENLKFYAMATPKMPKSEQHSYEANIDVGISDDQRQLVERATDFLVKRIREENPDIPILFQIDALRDQIYAGRPISEGRAYWMNQSLSRACDNNHCYFLDLGKAFSLDYHAHNIRFNPDYDGHWNSYGHHLVEEQLYNRLKELKLIN